MNSTLNNPSQVTDRTGILSSLEFHPAAALFPMMERGEFQKLADDIKAHGLLEPIALYQGQVLDGRNRLEACKLTGIEPRFEHIDNIPSPTVYVVSKNLHRRHLTVGQRSAIAVEMLPLLREESKSRQLSGLRHQPKSSFLPDGKNEEFHSNEKVAEIVGIGASSVGRAVAVKEADPEVFEQMKRGEITNFAAHEQVVEAKKAEPRKPTPENGSRARINAESHKRRMEEGLSMISSACESLNTLNLEAVSAALSTNEIAAWIDKAECARKNLLAFIKTFRNGGNHVTGTEV